MTTPSDNFGRNAGAIILALAAIALTGACTMSSLRWVGRTFPGFFVMANRVVPSISLPGWSAQDHRDIYQREVVAVNGCKVAGAAEIYSAVANLPTGSKITYNFAKNGVSSALTLASSRFTSRDYLMLFVPYLISGLGLILISVCVWYMKPEAAASRALLLGAIAPGVFAITAADLYGPWRFFRLHVLGEAFFPALLIHLGLVFPEDRFKRCRGLLIAMPYLVSAILGVCYEIYLYHPPVYSLIHNLCMVYAGIGGLVMLCAAVWDYWMSDFYLVRQRIRVLLLGLLGGYAFPGILMFCSGITGGRVPVNYAGFTVLVFPLSIGYAILKHDLFEIDAMLKRGVFYLALTLTLTVSYLGFLGVLDLTLRYFGAAQSTVFPLLFTLAVVLLINPLKDPLQRSLDKVFFRLRYDSKKQLERTSAALTSTLRLQEILSLMWRTVNDTLAVKQGGILLFNAARRQYLEAYPLREHPRGLPPDHPLIEELKTQRRRLVWPQDPFADPQGAVVRREAMASGSQARLIIPMTFKAELIGLLVLGRKESGHFFSADDADFLATLANQSALSISNAIAYQEIQALNTVLEEKVDERTRELAQSNIDLRLSIQRLERTHRELQRREESLTRAEKMAALGRLAAGIAHEINTPLGASMTALKLLQELIDEYHRSIGDPSVSAADHEGIAREMAELSRSTWQWMEKAAAHIRGLKAHTRDVQRSEERMFSVKEIVEQVPLLLSHRMRVSQCEMTLKCLASEPYLYGDPGKLSQVVTNLVLNAIDSYKGAPGSGNQIELVIDQDPDDVLVRVIDHGSGIAPEIVDRIFEDFFSTKELGEGTGLGLSIARDIVSNVFGGEISVQSSPGQGSTFTLRLPRGSQVKREPRVDHSATRSSPGGRVVS